MVSILLCDRSGAGSIPVTHPMKKPTRIVTDPKEIMRICLNQPKVTREQAIRSILKQNGKSEAEIQSVIDRVKK